jgi:inactivated superfamily I helicase/RecB family exonuclease
MLKGSLHKSLLVLPTSRSIREYIESNKSENQLLNKTIPIGEFFQKVAISPTYKNYCDPNLKKIFLQQSIDPTHFEALGFSSEFSRFFKQSDYIFRFFGEINSEYVSFDSLLQSDTYTLYSDHIEILQTIYTNYQNILQQNNYTDSIFLPQEFILNYEYLDQFESITLKLEGYLTKFEQKIIEQVSQYIPTYILVVFNEYNQKNKEFFHEVSLPKNIINHSFIIDFTNKKILQEQVVPQSIQDINISKVDSFLEQIGFIKHQVTQMVKQGIDPDRIALIVPDESIVDMLELFDKEHYFNFAMGRSIQNHKIVKLTELVNKIILDDEPLDYHKLSFFEVEYQSIQNLFMKNWTRKVDQELFEKVILFLYSFETNEELLEKLEHLKLSMYNMLFSNEMGVNINLQQFMKIFTSELNSITLDDTNGGKITVLGILETRSVSFDGVIVCDFNDDKIPKRSVKDKFISTSLKNIVELPTVYDRENLQKYYYKRVFDQAKYLSLCFVEDDLNVMSRYIIQLFSDYKQRIEHKDYASVLYNQKTIQPYIYDIKIPIDLSKRHWSASSLQTYLTCKRKYYFSNIAKIKEHEVSLKPKPYELGNIIHKALEEAVKEKQFNKEFVLNFLANFQKKNPYLTLELQMWESRIHEFFKKEEQRKDQNTQIIAVEQPFQIEHNGLNLIGTIDRIDKLQTGDFEILDYKTSSTLKVDTSKTYENSTDFQLEFYYLSQQFRTIESVAYYDLYNCQIKQEQMLNEKLQLLDKHLQELHTKEVEFSMTEKQSDCLYCPYKILCQKGNI